MTVSAFPIASTRDGSAPLRDKTLVASLREDTLSSSQLQVVLLSFVSLLLALLTALTFVVVSHVFARITPTIERDLERKAEVGSAKLASQNDLSLVIGDTQALEQAFARFAEDSDVSQIVATDAEGKILASYGRQVVSPSELFGAPPNRVSRLGNNIVAWSEASVEGAAVGRVATVISTERLRDGESLRRRILYIAILGALGGLVLSIGFVHVYIVPLRRVTQEAFDRLERAGHELAAKERMERELEIGARIQTCILPSEMGTDDLDISAAMQPAAEVGGDYYDAFEARGSFWLAIGDVAGHGLSSGLVMLMTQTAIGALARELPDAQPRTVLAAVNRLLFDNIRHRLGNDEHVTLSLFEYRGHGQFRFAGAHEEIIVFRAETGLIERVETPGPWLGIVPDVTRSLTESELHLGEGDVMVLYTDGVTEARNEAREQFGLDRVEAIVRRHAHEPAVAARDAIVEAVGRWSELQDDDISVVVVRRVSKEAKT